MHAKGVLAQKTIFLGSTKRSQKVGGGSWVDVFNTICLS